MSRYELQKLYRKICKKSPEVYGNEDLWMENMADADYVYLMVPAFDVIDILKERIRDDCEDSNAIKDFVSFLEADLIKREQSEKFEEIKRKYL